MSDSDPLDGRWADLDKSPGASAQMIQWHAPQTWSAIVADAVTAARTEALLEAADSLAADARLMQGGPSDKVRRTTLNVAAKTLRRRATHRLYAAATDDTPGGDK